MKAMCVLPALLIFLTACLPVEEDTLPPPVVEAGRTAEYPTVAVLRGDIQNARTCSVFLVASREAELSFPINDIAITGIYVKEGDFVREGDIIAELDRSSYQGEMEGIDLSSSFLELTFNHIDELHEFDLAQSRLSGAPVDEDSHALMRSAFMTALETNRIRRAHLDYEEGLRVLRAPMDGVVTYAMEYYDGVRTVADQRIATIADRSDQVLVLRGNDAELVNAGDLLEISIGGVLYSGMVTDPNELEISRPDNMSEKYIVIRDDEVAIYQSVATAYIVIDKSENTLIMPSGAVRRAGERVFTYILADGVRAIRDIEVGVESGREIEVLSGLNEGDLVIVG